MNKIILLSLIISFNIIAQDKYIMLKPLSWDELQLYQLDSLLSAEELKLSPNCPSTLRRLESAYERTATHLQHILGTNYSWSDFTNSEGLKCLVKHEKVSSIIQKEDKIINPNIYQVLNNIQARILISASQGIMDKDKKKLRNKQIAEAMRINRELTEKPYIKYGGLQNLLKYMDENLPSYSIDKRLLNNRISTSESGTNTVKLFSPLEIFETKYSQQQKDQLIENVKKKSQMNQ